jgi:glutathione S-transferase
MEYLVDRYDSEHKISFPKGTREWYAMKNWLYFQNAGVGPMQGQASKCAFFCSYLFAFSRRFRDSVGVPPIVMTIRSRS